MLILTTFDLDDYVFTALRGGASGFLLKDTAAASSCSRPSGPSPAGDALLGPGITRRLIREFARHPATAGGRTRPPAGDRRRRPRGQVTDRELRGPRA